MTSQLEKLVLDQTDYVNKKINEINKSNVEIIVENERISNQNQNFSIDVNGLTGKVETVMKFLEDNLKRIKIDYTQLILHSQKQTEENLLIVTDKLTKEVEYMNERMKSKLLYQMGLIDDPWCIKDDAIMDEELSENSKDSKDILMLRKVPSEYQWFDHKWEVEKVYHPDKFEINLKRSNSQDIHSKKIKLFKRQKKFKRIYDKREDEEKRKQEEKIAILIQKQIEALDLEKEDRIKAAIALKKAEKEAAEKKKREIRRIRANRQIASLSYLNGPNAPQGTVMNKVEGTLVGHYHNKNVVNQL